MSPRLAVLVSAVLFFPTACTSPGERYDSASDLAAQGRFADAASEYIRVLEDDPDYPGAREALQDVGDRAIQAFLDDANAAADLDRYADASVILERLDRLDGRAARVGVRLAVPDDYPSFRSEVHESAVEELIALGTAEAEAGRFGPAIDAYELAKDVPEAGPRAGLRIDELQGRALLAWGEVEIQDGRYRAAVDRFDRSLELLPANHPAAVRALALRDEAFELGTLWTAFLPLYEVAESGDVPTNVERELNDVLLFDYWSAPPPFIAQTDPGELRRALRREELDDVVPSTRAASRVGDLVGADLVVITELTEYVEERRNVRERRREATMQRPRRDIQIDTAYVELSATLRITTELTFSIIDPTSRRVIDRTRVENTSSGTIRWGEFEGNPELLNLSRGQRDLFDAEAQRAERRDIEEELVDELAQRYADRVFDRLILQVR